MATFDTPQPITATIDIPLGAVHLIASDRTDSVVTVTPSDPGRPIDVEVAEQTVVELADGHLTVRSPRPRGLAHIVSGASRYGSVEVVVELPAGSDVEVEAQVGDIRADGRLGNVQAKTSTGDIHLDDTGPTRATTPAGDVTLGRASGSVVVVAGGEVRVGDVRGDVELKNHNGRTWVGEVTGELKVRAANGDVSLARTHGPTAVKTANGAIRVEQVSGGVVDLATGNGRVEVGVQTGTAAWVDVQSKFGRIIQDLEDASAPGDDQPAVEIRARTSFGDITIHRA